MYTIIKNIFKKAMFTFALIIIAGTGIFFYQALRNYYGYCNKTGIRLSTEARLNIAITKYITTEQYSIDYSEISKVERKDNPSLKEVEKDFKLIPYENFAEFLKENPKCCKLTDGSSDGNEFGFWERADAKGNGMFDFKHKIRYRTQDGNIKEIISRKTYCLIYNCGTPRFCYYY